MRPYFLPLAFLLACTPTDDEDPVDTNDDTDEDTDVESDLIGYVVGDPSGPIWDQAETQLSLTDYDGQTDAGVWLATGAAANLDTAQADALATLYDAGFPVIMLTPTQDDVDKVAEHLKVMTFPVEDQDSTIEVLAFDIREASTGNTSWHSWGYETDDQFVRMGDHVVDWYEVQNMPLSGQRRTTQSDNYGPDDPSKLWPTTETWPSHTMASYNSTGIYVILKQFVYPITDTDKQRYVFPVVYHLSMEMEPTDSFPTAPVLSALEMTADAPGFGGFAPCTDNANNSCECVARPKIEGEQTCDDFVAMNPNSRCTNGVYSIDDTYTSPQTTLPSGSTTAGWAATVGGSVGMTLKGPTVGINTSATVSGSYTQAVPAVAVSEQSDLVNGTRLKWTLTYAGQVGNGGGLTEENTSMVFSGRFDIPYDLGQNQGTCAFALPWDGNTYNTGTFDTYNTRIRVGDPEGIGSSGFGDWQTLSWSTPHVMDDQQTKDHVSSSR